MNDSHHQYSDYYIPKLEFSYSILGYPNQHNFYSLKIVNPNHWEHFVKEDINIAIIMGLILENVNGF